MDHQAEGLDPPPLIALRTCADEIDKVRRRLNRLEDERRTLIDRALLCEIPAAKVAKAARLSRTRLYAMLRAGQVQRPAGPDEGARRPPKAEPPAPAGG